MVETVPAVAALPGGLYRAILPNDQPECERCEHTDRGGELYDDGDELLAFVPYHSLEAPLTDAAYEASDPSVM